MGHVFPFFVCLVIIDWMSDIVNFAFLGVGYFSIPINISELCSGMQLLGNSLILSGLAFMIC